jgi:hypothetical protein
VEIPTIAKPQGRLHQVGIKALQSGVSYHLREVGSAEERASGLLQTRDPEVRVMVRGEFVVESNAIENLSIRIDGVPFGIPADSFGRAPVKFPDPTTVPPPAPAKPAATKRSR